MIHLKKIGIQYKNQWILRKLTKEIDQGDLCIIKGNNGIGKSTLIKVIAGMIDITEGSICFGDHPKKIGYVSPEYHLYNELTLHDHIQIIKKTLTPISSSIQPEKELLSLHLNQYLNTPIEHFSTGTLARAKFFLSIIQNPDILLLDEPTSHLDKSNQQIIWNKIKEIQQKSTICFATNDPSEYNLGNITIDLNSEKLPPNHESHPTYPI